MADQFDQLCALPDDLRFIIFSAVPLVIATVKGWMGVRASAIYDQAFKRYQAAYLTVVGNAFGVHRARICGVTSRTYEQQNRI